uniref:Uncharacterized protein n=1 Tax=Neogobius melanostomus TaxID=47308 RepID=A0A8C6T2L3_9GOBI
IGSFPPHFNQPLFPSPGMYPPQCVGFLPGAPMIPAHMDVMVSYVPVVSQPPWPEKRLQPVRAKDEDSGPTTTVFVGNTSEVKTGSQKNFTSMFKAVFFQVFFAGLSARMILELCCRCPW